MSPRVTLFATVAIVMTVMTGCAHSTADSTLVIATLPGPGAGEDDGGMMQDSSAGASEPSTQGSPLCNASAWMGCYPDYAKSARSSGCTLSSPSFRASDGGASPSFRASDGGWGNDFAEPACHVQRANNDAGVQPVCTPSGANGDGMSCGAPSDCAPGYECVGEGKCQPYCCAGECDHSDQFCDIQPVVDDPLLSVPVCMAIHSCGLLDIGGGSCPANETCAVVRDTGATSCVAIGPKQAGDECNTANCARGLTCLGPPGQKSCYILCHTGQRAAECAGTPKQICKGGIPLFPVPGIGICE
jgi:hypothetical protein